MTQKQIILIAAAVCCAALAPKIIAEDNLLRTDRYTLQQLAASPTQTDPLSTIVQTEYPAQIETVGDAVDYLLLRSGYAHIRSEEAESALELPLPRIHRRMGPIDLRTALTTLLGPNWELKENRTLRLIWFQLSETTQEPEPPQRAKSAAAEADSQTSTEEVSPTAEAQQNEWNLHPDLTLRHNLKSWADQAKWALEWHSRHDYEIFHQSSYQGTFFDAVSAVLQHYEDAPVPLTASFYAGNSVLVIEPYHARGQTP